MLVRLAHALGVSLDVLLASSGNEKKESAIVRDPPVPHEPDATGTSSRVPVPIVSAVGQELRRTGERAHVAAPILQRAGAALQRIHAFPVPASHHDLRAVLYPASVLLVDPWTPPEPLSTALQDGRFVDGRYVATIGTSGLQVKDLRARPDGSVSVSCLRGHDAFFCRPSHQRGVRIHASVVGTAPPETIRSPRPQTVVQGCLFSDS
jgi:hypothetical protein